MRSVLVVPFCLVCAVGASAETLSVSPIPDDAEARFCYYAGLAYSEDASLTIDVPNRREGTEAVQKRELRGTRQDDSTSLKWVAIDIERQGLTNN